MVKVFTGFITEDGSKFSCETDAHIHEIKTSIIAKYPAMKSSVNEIIENVEWFANLLLPLSTTAGIPPFSVEIPPLDPDKEKQAVELRSRFLNDPAKDGLR